MRQPECLVWTLLLLTACSGGGGSQSQPTVPPVTNDRFAAIDDAAEAAFIEQGLDGMGLSIYDRSGTLVFQRMYGDFDPDERVAIASASKMVAGVVIFRLIDAGYVSLDSTTAEILGWSGEKGAIALRHLLSFTSGLPREHPCTLQVGPSLAECVEEIAREAPIPAPSERFDYGSTHLHVAARMAEVQVGATWNEIVRAQLADPLGLEDLTFYTWPRLGEGTTNPLIAGGLRASMNEYARILQLVFDQGEWEGAPLIAPARFEEQRREPFPEAIVGNTPQRLPGTDSSHYGLTAWLECTTPQDGCQTLSSPGAFGFTPWLDRDAGYFAIIGMEVDNEEGVVAFAVALKDELKPLIVSALD